MDASLSEAAEAERWRKYYDNRKDGPPRPLLAEALTLFNAESSPAERRLALDLGCGDGPDTAELLRRGWRVLAMDGQEEAIRRLRARADIPTDAPLIARAVRFEEMDLPPATLINAAFSLPFCPADAFLGLWGKVLASLLPGGRFCGQLFGDRDEWAGGGRTAHHTRAQADALLSSLIIEKFDEDERDGTIADGSPKHWHAFHIVARKP